MSLALSAARQASTNKPADSVGKAPLPLPHVANQFPATVSASNSEILYQGEPD